MGWMMVDPQPDGQEHEGWVVASVRIDGAWRELGYGGEAFLLDGDGCRRTMSVQAGCECGWRSQRMYCPLGTEWMPCTLMLAERHEDVAHDIWFHEHIERLTADGRTALIDRAAPWKIDPNWVNPDGTGGWRGPGPSLAVRS